MGVLYFHDVGGSANLSSYDFVQRNSWISGSSPPFPCSARRDPKAWPARTRKIWWPVCRTGPREGHGYKGFPTKLPAGITTDTIRNALEFSAGLDGFPTNRPTGMSRDSILKELVRLAADSGRTQAEIVALGLDTADIHAWVDTF